MRFVLTLLLLLPACDPGLPPANSATAQAQLSPQLLPLDALLIERTRPSRAAAAQLELEGRAARLSSARIAPPVTGDLAARGQRLRERAEQLRDVDI